MLFVRSSPSINRVDDDRERPMNSDSLPSRPAEPLGEKPPAPPSRQSLRGLDWFIFFLADVQTGFGPFIAVYLTTQKWTQVEIGLVLSIGGVVGLIGQMPGGAIVDAARSERLVAGLAVATIGVSALGYAAWPIFPVVVVAATLHAAASCVLGPAIAAISLGLVGPLAIGERFGRNARYASLGNGVAAAVMGTCGYLLSSRSVFLVTFILAIPTLVAVQVFDGITAAVCSVMVPLIIADVAFGSGHFNLAQGIVGTATGIGASLSTVLAGYISDRFGSSIAFTGLAAVAATGLALIWLVMPETRRST